MQSNKRGSLSPETGSLTPVMQILKDHYKHTATVEVINENYDLRVYGRKQRYAKPTPLHSIDGLEKSFALADFTMADFNQLLSFIQNDVEGFEFATCTSDERKFIQEDSLTAAQDELPETERAALRIALHTKITPKVAAGKALAEKVLQLTENNYAQTEFTYVEARAFEAFATSKLAGEENKAARASQNEVLQEIQTLDSKVIIKRDAASSEDHAFAIANLVTKVLAVLKAQAPAKMVEKITGENASNLSRMEALDEAAISLLRKLYNTNKGNTFAEIRRNRSSTFDETTIDDITIALTVAVLFEAAYFGSGRACQSLLDMNEQGLIELTAKQILQLVTVQIDLHKKSSVAQRPRDGDNNHFEPYSYAEQFSATQFLPDLLGRPKAWSAVRGSQQVFMALMQVRYFPSGLEIDTLFAANESLSEEGCIPEMILCALFNSAMTNYFASKDPRSILFGDDSQIMPKIFKYKRVWAALEKDAINSYRILWDFQKNLEREVLSQPVAIEVGGSYVPTPEEAEEIAAEEARVAEAIAPATLAKRGENEPESFIAYVEDQRKQKEERKLSPNQKAFTEKRSEVIKALFELRHKVFGEKLSEVYEQRNDITDQEKINSKADKATEKKLKAENKVLIKPYAALQENTKSVIAKIDEEETKDFSQSNAVEYQGDKSGLTKSKAAADVERELQEATDDRAVKAELVQTRNRRKSLLGGKSDQEILEVANTRFAKCKGRFDTLREQQKAYQVRKATRKGNIELIRQVQGSIDALLQNARKLSQVAGELTKLQEEGQRIKAVIAENSVIAAYFSGFVDSTCAFIKSQQDEVAAREKRTAKLERLQREEKKSIETLVKTNPITECIRLAFLSYVQDLIVYGHPSYDWKKLIAEALEDDVGLYVVDETLAFKKATLLSSAREAFPIVIAANAPLYMKLFALFTSSTSHADFWAKVQGQLFDANGLVGLVDWKAIINKDFPVADGQLDALTEKYFVAAHQDPALAMFNTDLMLALVLSVEHLFSSHNSQMKPEQVLKEAMVTCHRLRKLINRLDATSQSHRLGDYLRIALIALGDPVALKDLLLPNEANPVWRTLGKPEGFELPFALNVVLRDVLLANTDSINPSTIKVRMDILKYLKTLFEGNDFGFDFLFKISDQYITAQSTVGESAQKEYAKWVKAVATVTPKTSVAVSAPLSPPLSPLPATSASANVGSNNPPPPVGLPPPLTPVNTDSDEEKRDSDSNQSSTYAEPMPMAMPVRDDVLPVDDEASMRSSDSNQSSKDDGAEQSDSESSQESVNTDVGSSNPPPAAPPPSFAAVPRSVGAKVGLSSPPPRPPPPPPSFTAPLAPPPPPPPSGVPVGNKPPPPPLSAAVPASAGSSQVVVGVQVEPSSPPPSPQPSAEEAEEEARQLRLQKILPAGRPRMSDLFNEAGVPQPSIIDQARARKAAAQKKLAEDAKVSEASKAPKSVVGGSQSELGPFENSPMMKILERRAFVQPVSSDSDSDADSEAWSVSEESGAKPSLSAFKGGVFGAAAHKGVVRPPSPGSTD